MSQAAARALETIQDYWVDENERASFPVDPYLIAARMGLRVEHRVGLPHNVDGLLLKESPDTPVLAIINHDRSPNRQRFTLAHEIGHFTYIQENEPEKLVGLGLVEYKDEVASLGTDKREVDANTFAANLLMPEAVVRLWNYEGRSREQMALGFGVSLQAMGNRLNSLGLSHIV